MKHETLCYMSNDHNSLSIHDVAKKVGFSAATVSRVLNNGPVSAKTRAKVEKAIAEMGYQPNLNAVSLRTQQIRKIGVVIPDIGNPAYALTVRFAHEILRKNDYQLILGNTYGSLEEELLVLQMMSRERVSGIIINTVEGESDEESHNTFRNLMAQNIHMVFLGPPKMELGIDSVSVDNRAAMKKAVNLLVQTGRKRIAYLAGGGGRKASDERRKGFADALEQHAMEPAAIICDGTFTLDNAEVQAEHFLLNNKADAFVCGNDMMAIGVIQAAEKLGLRVPEDMAVVGFDNIGMATITRPRLTTIHQPFEEIVNKACALLLARIDGSTSLAAHHYNIQPEIIVREST